MLMMSRMLLVKAAFHSRILGLNKSWVGGFQTCVEVVKEGAKDHAVIGNLLSSEGLVILSMITLKRIRMFNSQEIWKH